MAHQGGVHFCKRIENADAVNKIPSRRTVSKRNDE
jgi:hypothetical protein